MNITIPDSKILDNLPYSYTTSFKVTNKIIEEIPAHKTNILLYSYKQPVVKIVQATMRPTLKYNGLSLDEIEQKFGKEEMLFVRDFADRGFGDLTKQLLIDEEPSREPLSYETIIDFEIDIDDSSYYLFVEISVVPSQYNMQNLKKQRIMTMNIDPCSLYLQNKPNNFIQTNVDIAIENYFRRSIDDNRHKRKG
tara:strand:+ start:556 stop:1137 length:582 start_codon:yes stop_codon:yes gene_type:complete